MTVGNQVRLAPAFKFSRHQGSQRHRSARSHLSSQGGWSSSLLSDGLGAFGSFCARGPCCFISDFEKTLSRRLQGFRAFGKVQPHEMVYRFMKETRPRHSSHTNFTRQPFAKCGVMVPAKFGDID